MNTLFRTRRKPSTSPRPQDGASVLLASEGVPYSDWAIRTALARAAGRPIKVLSVAKIYGTALGMQHPGLLPNKTELACQEEIVAKAVRRIETAKGRATGEVVATRDNAKTFLRAATRYSVQYVVLEPGRSGRIRRLVEGDPATSLRRRLDPDVEVLVAEPRVSAAGSQRAPGA